MPVTVPGELLFILAIAAMLALKAVVIVGLVYLGVRLALRAKTFS